MAHRGEYKVPPEETARARAVQGIPQPAMPHQLAGVVPTGSGEDLTSLLAMLKSGQFSAGALLQLIAALSGLGQVPGGLPAGGSPIEQAFYEGQ